MFLHVERKKKTESFKNQSSQSTWKRRIENPLQGKARGRHISAKAEARQKCLKFNINWDYFIWDYRIFPFHKSLYAA